MSNSTSQVPPSNQEQYDDDLVAVEIKVYKTTCEDMDSSTAILVGERGLYYPKHEDSMVWLPKGLIFSISPPSDNGTQTIRIPRWLAAKKGLKYHG